jgi:hypothetical protein
MAIFKFSIAMFFYQRVGGKHAIISSGWWLTYPSENIKVSWDYSSGYMEK